MNDPIVEEVRRVREAHAARFHYDLDAIFRDIKEQEKENGAGMLRVMGSRVYHQAICLAVDTAKTAWPTAASGGRIIVDNGNLDSVLNAAETKLPARKS